MTDGISRENLIFAVPHVLTDDTNMNHMVDTLADKLSLLTKNANLPILFPRIDQLPVELLDILAQDFKVDWYDYNADVETKRAVIKDCFYVHRHLGTRSAVVRAITDVYGEGEIEEWFEYEGGPGEPYHFRVHTSNTKALMEDRVRFLRLVDIVKNVRSVLDNVTYDGETNTTLRTAAVACSVISGATAIAQRRTEEDHVE